LKEVLSLEEGFQLTDESDLSDLGMDSLRFVNFMIQLEDRHGVTLNPELLDVDTFDRADNLMVVIERSAEQGTSMKSEVDRAINPDGGPAKK